jgi:hypothetical protein
MGTSRGIIDGKKSLMNYADKNTQMYSEYFVSCQDCCKVVACGTKLAPVQNCI